MWGRVRSDGKAGARATRAVAGLGRVSRAERRAGQGEASWAAALEQAREEGKTGCALPGSGPSGKKKELVGCLGWISFSYFLSLFFFKTTQTN